MMKLDKVKSNKICTLIVGAALAFTIAGCSTNDKQYDNDLYSADDKYILFDREKQISVNFPKEYLDLKKIEDCEKDDTIVLMINDETVIEKKITEYDLEEIKKQEKGQNIFDMISLAFGGVIVGMGAYSILRVRQSLINRKKESDMNYISNKI